jgi:hypothetical protein
MFSVAGVIEKTRQSSNLPTKPQSSLGQVDRRTITAFSSAIKIVFFYISLLNSAYNKM